MNETEEFFKENKYVYLKNVMDTDECEKIKKIFFDLISKNLAPPDPMCPLSDAIHAVFNIWLLKKQHVFESALNLKLYPTYSYARIYRPDDSLKFHIDRPSCEITSTITIKFSGQEIWPIYLLEKKESEIYRTQFIDHCLSEGVGNTYDGTFTEGKVFYNKIKIDVAPGDAVVFRGDELFHWREPYTEGDWQIQLFLHYVDANGPNAEWKHDKKNLFDEVKKWN
jgi:hypothetical protein